MNCWASCLGNCTDIRSGEHYVSAGIFRDNTKAVLVSGLKWMNTESQAIGLPRAVAKILCSEHNNSLSEFDNEACKLSEFLRKIKINPLKKYSIEINGKYIEKWAIKIFYNLGVLGAFNETILPQDNLVRYIYCDSEIDSGVGLYFVRSRIFNKDNGDYVYWHAIKNKSGKGGVIGMQFYISGLCFIINLNPVHYDDIKLESSFCDNNEIYYRPRLIIFDNDNNYNVNKITFKW